MYEILKFYCARTVDADATAGTMLLSRPVLGALPCNEQFHNNHTVYVEEGGLVLNCMAIWHMHISGHTPVLINALTEKPL